MEKFIWNDNMLILEIVQMSIFTRNPCIIYHLHIIWREKLSSDLKSRSNLCFIFPCIQWTIHHKINVIFHALYIKIDVKKVRNLWNFHVGYLTWRLEYFPRGFGQSVEQHTTARARLDTSIRFLSTLATNSLLVNASRIRAASGQTMDQRRTLSNEHLSSSIALTFRWEKS